MNKHPRIKSGIKHERLLQLWINKVYKYSTSQKPENDDKHGTLGCQTHAKRHELF